MSGPAFSLLRDTPGARGLLTLAAPALVSALAGCGNSGAGETRSAPTQAGSAIVLDTEFVHEASGVAVSRRNPDILWTHNDSGDFATLYAINSQGEYQGAVDVLNADAFDWEDIAAFELDGEPWLLVADIGDNLGIRTEVSLYLLPEPDIIGLEQGFSIETRATRRIDLKYANGARDAESMAVDPDRGDIYIISKRDNPPVLYRLALDRAAAQTSAVAERVTTLDNLAGTSSSAGAANQPTALDISADGRRWLITSYKQALVYERDSDEALSTTLKSPTRRLPLPDLPQVEAGALSADGKIGYFLSEQIPARLVVKPLN